MVVDDSEEVLAHVLANSEEAIAIVDGSGELCGASPLAQALFGPLARSPGERPWFQRLALFLPDGVSPCPDDENPFLVAFAGKAVKGVELFLADGEGGGSWYVFSSTPRRRGMGPVVGAVVVARDVSSVKRFQAALADTVTHDELTSLLNRRGFLNAVEERLKLAYRLKAQCCLVFVDVEQQGRPEEQVSGELLRAVGQVIEATLRETDVVARVENDQFAGCAFGSVSIDGPRLVERLTEALAQHATNWGEEPQFEFHVRCSSYQYKADDSVVEMLEWADRVIYEQRQERFNRKSDRVLAVAPHSA